MNRRSFMRTTAGGALAARIQNEPTDAYDLIIRGGRVIDPSIGLRNASNGRCSVQAARCVRRISVRRRGI